MESKQLTKNELVVAIAGALGEDRRNRNYRTHEDTGRIAAEVIADAMERSGLIVTRPPMKIAPAASFHQEGWSGCQCADCRRAAP